MCNSLTEVQLDNLRSGDHRRRLPVGRSDQDGGQSTRSTRGLIELLADEPRIGVLECSRRLGVARGTVQARLDRLRGPGVIRGFGPEVDPAALGLPGDRVRDAGDQAGPGRGRTPRTWRRIPEVLELHTITGTGDMLCRLVARSNADLQRVIDRVVGVDGHRPDLQPDRAVHPDPVPGPAAGRRGGRPAGVRAQPA